MYSPSDNGVDLGQRHRSAWTDGFLSGNGEYGAVYYGAPTLKKMIFNHHRFVLPNGSRSVMPR
ncbi:hypothetical protein ACFV2X_46495 [Streptomyces sp. NPDC059679]|uniref:hypothetical protein n=1 Tax=Streptomyces sp. NPDC059679 TaxID=3346903 RepID=UPI0036A9693F